MIATEPDAAIIQLTPGNNCSNRCANATNRMLRREPLGFSSRQRLRWHRQRENGTRSVGTGRFQPLLVPTPIPSIDEAFLSIRNYHFRSEPVMNLRLLVVP